MASKRRVYIPEFKAEAVKLVTEGGLLRRRWRPGLPRARQAPSFEEKLRRLRAENKRLRCEALDV